MYRFFVDTQNVYEDKIIITGSDVNHIKNVLRMKEGDEILISDGEITDVKSRINIISDEEIICDIIEESQNRELPVYITLFQGLPKGDKMELIVQKAVELGAAEIVPVEMKRCVVKLDEKKASKKIKRYEGIAEAAAKQSKRSIIPKIGNVVKYKKALEIAKEYDMVLVPYEAAGNMGETKKVLSSINSETKKIAIFIGPEGGFDEEEINEAINNGFKEVSLGKRILRTETAGMTLLSILMYYLED